MTRLRWTGSLKTRLALSFFLGMLILIVLGGGFVLGEQEHSLLDNIDTSLTARADDIVALLEDDPRPPGLGINRDEDTIAVILDGDGATVSSTDRFGDPAELVTQVGGTTEKGRDVSLPSFQETAGTDRMRAVHLIGPRGESVFVAQSLQRVDANLDALQNDLLTVGLLLAVLGGILCWFVVRRALRPVHTIVEKATEISLARLDQRLPKPTRNDEVGELTTTINAMLARLETSAEQQRRLIADIAHELRSPLTAVATQLEVDLAHRNTADWPATAEEALDETRRLQRLIDDMLLLAKLDDADSPKHHQLVDLDQLVLDTIARLAPATTTTFDQSAVSAGLVRGDKSQLERAVHNLIDNAARHASTTVTVRLVEAADTVRLDVTDDGSGIPIADRDKIFERFYRTQAARDRCSGGSGLGLALTKETILAHGGTIGVVDRAPQGVTFAVTMPSADHGQPPEKHQVSY